MYRCCLCDTELTTRTVVEAGVSITETNDCENAECKARLKEFGVPTQAERDARRAEIRAMIRAHASPQ